jgi:tRNA(fMet)-specific endonuclease VapC
MNLYVLDTDIVSLLQHGHAGIKSHIDACGAGQVAISVITVDEQLSAWYTLVRQARKPSQLALAYDRLAENVSFLSRIKILSYPESAIALFEDLKRAKLGVDGNDLRIGATVLNIKATVVTRNVRDFALIPGLKIEDWSNP